jgi:hypothetical protein
MSQYQDEFGKREKWDEIQNEVIAFIESQPEENA